MRIVVCVKQVYDPATVKISRSREEFDLRQAVKQMNPADRFAIEEALSLREAAGGDVWAVTIGDAGAEDAVREAVAMGADHGLLIITGPEATAGGGAAVARILQAFARPSRRPGGEPANLSTPGPGKMHRKRLLNSGR